MEKWNNWQAGDDRNSQWISWPAFSDTGAYDFKVWEPLDGPPMIVYGEAYFNDYAGLDKMKAWLETEKGMDFIQRFSKTAKVVDRLVMDQIL